MNSTTPPSLATKIAVLAEQGIDPELSPEAASNILETLRQDSPDLPKFLLRKGLRLPEKQQEAMLRVVHASQDRDCVAVLEAWSRSPAVSLSIRAHAGRDFAALRHCVG